MSLLGLLSCLGGNRVDGLYRSLTEAFSYNNCFHHDVTPSDMGLNNMQTVKARELVILYSWVAHI